MTITQPVNNTKAKKDRSQSKHNPAQSKAQEASSSHTPVLIVHPNSGVQHTSNVAPVPGQHQFSLQQSSLPWWAWSPPSPPSPWNWIMWSPGAFHQLLLANQVNQVNIHQPTAAPNQFPGYSLVPTPATFNCYNSINDYRDHAAWPISYRSTKFITTVTLHIHKLSKSCF